MRFTGRLHRFTPALCAAAAGLALSSPAALATGGSGFGWGFGDSAQIEIKGTIAPMCQFTTTPNLNSIGQMATDLVTELGSLGFTCNIGTSSSVSLTVKSLNGALKRYGGSETVAYQVAWNVQGANDAFVTIPTSPAPFALLAGPSGVEQLGVYKVKVTGPTVGVTAGTYKDVVTYTISP